MTMESKPNSKPRRLLKAFFEARGIKVTADSLRMWLDALCDLTEAEIEFALRRFNRDSTDFPTPAAVRRFAGPKGLSDEQRASVAWDAVTAAIRDHGAYRSVDFSDRIINAVVRAYGGWERLCGEDLDQRTWNRKRFIEAYVTVSRTGIGNASPLPGIAERDNGCAREKPLLIDCGLPAHAMQKRLAYTAPSETPRIAGPAVRKLSEAFAERMQTAAREKSERKAAADAEAAERMRVSSAAKESQKRDLQSLLAKQRDEFIARVKAKRERKLARKAVKS